MSRKSALAESASFRMSPCWPQAMGVWTCTVLLILWLAMSASAQAQVMLDKAAGGEDEEPSGGFGVVQVSDDFTTALGDYERYVRKSEWEKAFRALGEMHESDASALCRGKNGLVIPVRRRIWDAVVTLPPKGRSAFDVFYGGQADAIAKRMNAPQARGTDEGLTAARELFGEYFISKHGVQAADRLGDASFQEGWFNDAVIYWRAILDHHTLDAQEEARISVKLAYAYARADKSDAYEKVARQVERRFADQSVTIAGESVSAIEAIQMIGYEPGTSDETKHGLGMTDLAAAPADEADPTWQFRFMSDQAQRSLNDALSNWWGPASGMGGLVPANDTDGERIYCNWLGVCFAIDAQTGKLLWRSKKFKELYTNFQNFRHGSGIASRYDLIAAEDVVVTLTLPLDKLNHWREPYRLEVLDGKTGNVKWNTSGVNWLKEISFIGRPLIHEDKLIAVSHPQQGSEVTLKVMSIEDSQVQWELPLGQAVMINTRHGQEHVPDPALLLDGDQLYVLTNNGALLTIDIPRRRIAWALTYEPPPGTNNQNHFWGGGPSDAGTLPTRGGLWTYEGVLYFKETNSPTLYALDPQQRKILWKRPVEPDATVVGIDAERVYLLGRELLAIDRKTRGLKWSTTLPIGVGRLRAIHDDGRLSVLTGRGIYEINKANGDTLRIFRGHDLTSKGGSIDLLGDKLICISNHTLSMYSLDDTTVSDSDTEPDN